MRGMLLRQRRGVTFARCAPVMLRLGPSLLATRSADPMLAQLALPRRRRVLVRGLGQRVLRHPASDARQPVGQLLGRQLLAEALHHQRQAEGAGRGQLDEVAGAACACACSAARSRAISQLLRQHLGLGLAEQPVAGVVLAEDLEEQARRGLQLARALRRARVAAEHQPGDARDLAKAPLRQLAAVQAGQHVVQQLARRRTARGRCRRCQRRLGSAASSSKP